MFRRIFRWILRTLLFFAVLFAFAIISDYLSHRVKPGSVLVLKLTGAVVERGGAGVVSVLRGENQTPLNVVRRALKDGARDLRIAGLAVKVIDPKMEFAQAQELSAMIRDFASSGKWTTAYMDTAGEGEPGNLDYVVASSAHEVSMMPRGELNLVGVELREFFLRGTLDWLGITPDVYALGVYKSFRNQFTEKGFTPQHREEDDAMVNSLYQQLVNQVAQQRNLQSDEVRALVDRAPLNASAGRDAHLIDRLEYEDEFTERFKHRGGVRHAAVDYDNYARPRLIPTHIAKDKIAIVYGSGEIDRGEGGFDPLFSPGGASMGSESMAEAFKAARDDDSVRAVVFRINSPGGSVVASELIRRQVELTAKRKPLIISMSNYAASGGYWVATPGTRIVAEPGTITGSIGVVMARFDLAPAAAKLGITSDAVTRGRNVTLFDQFTELTPEQKSIVQDQQLAEVYKDFVERVAQGRHLKVEEVEAVAQGRVWTGEQAIGIKLVDKLGDMDTAIADAKTEAKLRPDAAVDVVELPEQPSFLEQAFGAGGGNAQSSFSPRFARALAPWLRVLRTELAKVGAAGAVYCYRLPAM